MKIEQIYESIAKNIANSVDERWEEACLQIERGSDDAIGFKGGFIASGNHKSFKFRNFDRRKLVNDTKELHEITTENDSNQWNRAKFTLKPDGEFSIEFEWDQELADEISAYD